MSDEFAAKQQDFVARHIAEGNPYIALNSCYCAFAYRRFDPTRDSTVYLGDERGDPNLIDAFICPLHQVAPEVEAAKGFDKDKKPLVNAHHAALKDCRDISAKYRKAGDLTEKEKDDMADDFAAARKRSRTRNPGA